MPNFGKDHEIEASQGHEKAAEGSLNHKWVLKKDEDDKFILPEKEIEFKLLQTGEQTEREPLLTWKPTPPKTHPINYFVPNFGTDEDIAASQLHEQDAEKSLNHPWVLRKDDDDKFILPPRDIEFKLLQTDAEIEREPLLTWKPTPPKTHPMDYFVPNFGVDEDIQAT